MQGQSAAQETAEPGVQQRIGQLSAAQIEVLQLVDQHLSSKEIAARLSISPHTVDQRIREALRILGVERRAHAARIVTEHSSRSATLADGDGSGVGPVGGSRAHTRSARAWPIPTTNRPNPLGAAERLIWILCIALFSAMAIGMFLAGIESFARLTGMMSK